MNQSLERNISEDQPKVFLYSPVYYTSPGTQMRIDLIRKSLNFYGIKNMLVYEEQETSSQKIYHSFLTENLLTKKTFWHLIGALLARKLCSFSKYSRTILLFLDVCASALPYLRKCFDKIILSVEDLTPRYKRFRKDATKRYLEIFVHFAQYADHIITPAYTLTYELRELGLEAHTVPIGLEPYISPEEALRRNLPIKILHAGQLSELEQVKVILNLARKYIVFVHHHGKYSRILDHLKVIQNIYKYRVKTPHDAVRLVKIAHLGLVLVNRPAYTLSRLYFHIALLQPIIGGGVGPWIREAKLLGIDIEHYNYERIDQIIQNYEYYVRRMHHIQHKLMIPQVHIDLISLIRR